MPFGIGYSLFVIRTVCSSTMIVISDCKMYLAVVFIQVLHYLKVFGYIYSVNSLSRVAGE